MTPTRTTSGIIAGTLIIMGVVEASVLNETPIERVEVVADERVEAKQIDNVVETTLPWKGERGIKVTYDLGEPTLEERLADKRKQEVITEEVNSRAEEITAKIAEFEALKATRNIEAEDVRLIDEQIALLQADLAKPDGFKVDILLNEKPDTNVFCYAIDGAENYDFFYQGELTPEEIAEGMERPEHIVGSYAVYHKELKDHRIGGENYATGKVMHIPRPQVWSMTDESTKVWADLSYDESGLCVTVPQEFLDKAVYPVRVDPTFGYTLQGASTGQWSTDRVWFIEVVSPSTISLDSMSVFSYVFTGTDFNFKCGVWNASDGTFVTNGLTDVISGSTAGVFTAPFSTNPNVTFGTSYWLGCVPDSPEAGRYFDTTADTTRAGFDANSYATPVDIGAPTTFSNSITSLYATFSCSGDCMDVYSFGGVYSWVAPTGVNSVDVACWGGGGGGFDDVSGLAGAGGGGGAFASSTIEVTPGYSYTFTIASSSPENEPTTGKFSSFAGDTETVLACGGTGATSMTVNGIGGTVACSTGDVENDGGNGADGDTTDDTGGGGGGAGGPHGDGALGGSGSNNTTGGGGGGANGGGIGGQPTGGTAGTNAGAGGDGGNGTDGSPGANGIYGGGGGGGGDNSFLAGGNGGFPGGGGGGAEGNGGVGASGQCIITYTSPGPEPILSDFAYCREWEMTAGGGSGGVATTSTAGFPLVATTTLADWKSTTHGGNIQSATGTSYLNDMPLDFYITSDNNCDFSTGDGLDFYTERWASTTGDIVFWVEATDISSTTAKAINIYYGDNTVWNRQNKKGVWDGAHNYVAVYNLDEPPVNADVSTYDATSNNNDLTESGTMDSTDQVAGRLGGAVGWNVGVGSTDQLFRSGGTYTPVGDDFSLSVWMQTNSGLERSLMHWGQTQLNAGHWGISFGPSSQLIFCASPDGGSGSCTRYTATYTAGSGDISDGAWHHIFMQRDKANGTVTWIIDGVNVYTTTSVTTAQLDDAQSVAFAGMGKMRATAEYYFGPMDQFQLTTGLMTDADSRTMYNNQKSSAVFWTIGAEQTPPAPPSGTTNQQSEIWYW